MNYKTFIESKTFRKILWVIGGTLVFLVIFQAGVFVGERKAGFSFREGERYYETFGGERGFAGMLRGDKLLNAHGAIGTVVRIDLPTFVMEDRAGVEKVILIGDDSSIRRFHDAAAPTDLKVGDAVMVIGSPDDKAQIEARLIRVLPAPVTASTTPPSSSLSL